MEKTIDLKSSTGTVSPQKVVLTVFKYIFIFFVFVCLSYARLYNMRPFSAGLFLALVFFDVQFAFIAPLFVAAEVIAVPSLFSFLSALICVATAFIAKFIKDKTSKSWAYVMPVFAAVSRTGLVFDLISKQTNILLFFLSIMITVATVYVASYGLKPVLRDKMRYKLIEPELFCLGALLTFFALGLSLIPTGIFPLIPLFCFIAFFTGLKLKGLSCGVLIAFCFGLGLSIGGGSTGEIAALIFAAVISAVFADAPKILFVLSGAVAYALFMFYFDSLADVALMSLASAGSGALIYAILPSKIISRIKNMFFISHDKAAVRYMINKNRAAVSDELISSSYIFDSMSEVLANRVGEGAIIPGRVENKVCAFCDNYENCKSEKLSSGLDKMAKITAEKGRMAVHDIPDAVSNKCVYLGRLVGALNELEDKRKITLLREECDKNARSIVAAQLKGISNILKDVAVRGGVPVPFDCEREKVLIEELNFLGVCCSESLIANDSVVLIVRSECLDRRIIERTVSKMLKARYKITSVDDTAFSGFLALMLKASPKYDMVFGVASKPLKSNERSGDTHSFIKLNGSRLMIALCDGMGSGDKAAGISDSAISLVESFYKAGFESDLALKSVNNFLSLSVKEGFSALDICVVDLDSGSADVIKLGSPATYIKKKDIIEKIDGSSLPLGAVESIKPSIAKIDLTAGDTIMLVSDGVSDNFAGDKLAAAFNNMRTTNPKTLSEGILSLSIDACGGQIKDDSTIITARLIEAG